MGRVAAGIFTLGLSEAFRSNDKKSSISPAPLPQTPSVDDAAAKAEEVTKKKRVAAAANNSVFTSPLGIAGEASVSRKTLLGQ